MVYGQVARPEDVGPIEHRPRVENTYAIPHVDGSSFRDIAASDGTAQAHPARLGRLCLNASLLRGRRMMLCATGLRADLKNLSTTPYASRLDELYNSSRVTEDRGRTVRPGSGLQKSTPRQPPGPFTAVIKVSLLHLRVAPT